MLLPLAALAVYCTATRTQGLALGEVAQRLYVLLAMTERPIPVKRVSAQAARDAAS